MGSEGFIRQLLWLLLQAARQSVVNVTSLVDARGGPLGLNPMQVPQGTGSGFLWDSAGHIVTNWHVSALILVSERPSVHAVAESIFSGIVRVSQACAGVPCMWQLWVHAPHLALVAVLLLTPLACPWVGMLQVIRNAQSARVTLWNNETYEATLRGVEPDKDLAVLKIKKPPPPATLRPVTVGSSGGLQVAGAASCQFVFYSHSRITINV